MSEAQFIETSAANWLARQDSGAWSAQSAEALEDWLNADTRHRVAYLRLRAAWSRADRLAASCPPVPVQKRPRRRVDGWRAVIRKRTVVTAASAALVLIVATPIGFIHMSQDVYETTVGGRSVTPLPDGSRVELSSDTQVRTSFVGPRREVWLGRGEAYFDVAHDGRPFVVRAGNSKVVVEGTRFSVRRDEKNLIVRVAEGRVRIESDSGKSIGRAVLPGQEARVKNGHLQVVNRGLDAVADEMSWRQGRLQFRQATLDEVAEAFNRHNRIKLVVTDQEVGRTEIGGSFEATNVDGFAEVLRNAYGMKIERRDDAIFISHSRTGF